MNESLVDTSGEKNVRVKLNRKKSELYKNMKDDRVSLRREEFLRSWKELEECQVAKLFK